MPEESYYEIDIKGAQANKPLKKLDPPKPKKESTDPEPNPAEDLNTFSLDPELRETLHILSDYVILNKKLAGNR